MTAQNYDPYAGLQTGLGRRRFLALGAAAAGGAILAACGSDDKKSSSTAAPATTAVAAPAETTAAPVAGAGRYGGPTPKKIGGKLTFVSSGSEGAVFDARQKYIFDVLREDYGVEVTIVSDLDYALVEAQIKTNQIDWDVIDADSFFAARAAKEGWLEPIDYSIIDASQLVEGAAKEFAVLQGVGAHHMAWNTSQAYGAGKGPTSWAEFYDTKLFPGRRALRSGALQTLPGAALAAGILPADLYPLNLDKAFESLERVRDSVIKWVDGGQAMQDLALAGEADIFNLYTSRCVTLKSEGEPIDFRFDQGTAEEADLIIIKGSKNSLQAQYALALSSNTPEYHKVLAEATNIGFTNIEGMAMVDPAIQPLLSTAPDNYRLLTPAGNDWWADNQPAAEQRLTEWILG